VERGGKKTASAVHQEVTRELDTLLPRIFAERRRAGELDIEAVELAFRTALHSAGAAGLTELLRQPGPVRTSVACACGGQARYKDMRLKPILTVLGAAKMLRAYYWCSGCRQGRNRQPCWIGQSAIVAVGPSSVAAVIPSRRKPISSMVESASRRFILR